MSYEKKGTHRSSIPHLRKQSQQLIPPLQVLSKENVARADFVVDMTHKRSILREDHVPIHPGQAENNCIEGASYVARVSKDATNENV